MAKIGKSQEIPVDKLIPYAKNAKKHPQEQIDLLVRSIEEYGFLNPCLIDKEFNIIAGHGRVMAAKQMGMEKVPCLFVEGLTEAQYKAYVLADNRLTELGEWNMDLVMMELQDLQDMDFDISLTGFEMPEIEVEDPEIIEDDVPEEVETRCKLGDIWQMGGHRLICGDSTDVDVIDKLMDGVKPDMVMTDPPYGNGTSGKYGRGQLGVRTIAGDEDLSVFNEFVSIMNTDKIVYFLQWRTLAESFETIRNKGLRINTVGVWDKKNAGLNGAGGISEQWEAVIFAGNIKYKKFGGNVFSIAREQHKREDSPHPHQKPIKLLAEIFDYLDGCKIFLDPFGGSGSTLIACEQLNRKCYMCELDPHYCDVIIQRWEDFTGKKAELLS